MTLYITEKEMIDRYLDGLNQSASRAKEMITAELSDKPRVFTEFLHGIKVAAGSAHQLAHAQVDHSTRWLEMRDLLENIIEIGTEMPTFGGSEKNGMWFSIKKSLEVLSETGRRLFSSKGISKAVLNFELDQRLKNAPNLVGSPL